MVVSDDSDDWGNEDDDYWGDEEEIPTETPNPYKESPQDVTPPVESSPKKSFGPKSALGKMWLVVIGLIVIILVVVGVMAAVRGAAKDTPTPPSATQPTAASKTSKVPATIQEVEESKVVVKVEGPDVDKMLGVKGQPELVVTLKPSQVKGDSPSVGDEATLYVVINVVPDGFNIVNQGVVVGTYPSPETDFDQVAATSPSEKPTPTSTPTPTKSPSTKSTEAPVLGEIQETVATIDGKYMDLSDSQVRYWVGITLPGVTKTPIRLDVYKSEFDNLNSGDTVPIRFQVDQLGRIAVVG